MIISENVVLIEGPEFGVFDKTVVTMFLRMVQDNFYRWLGGKPVGEKRCLVCYQDNNPEIYLKDGYHQIRLNTHGNYWCQWVYQYAHEFCHHLIDGPCDGVVSGLKWFEETLCELSSLHNLYEMACFCEVSTKENLRRYAPAVRDYLSRMGDSLSASENSHKNLAEYILQHTAELSQDRYHREIYSTIAFSMLPVFRRNPYLWRIVPQIGDSCCFVSLGRLFDRLQKSADNSYSQSLAELRKMMLGAACQED